MFCCTYSFYVLFYTVLFFPTVAKLYSNRLPGVWPQMEQRPIKNYNMKRRREPIYGHLQSLPPKQ